MRRKGIEPIVSVILLLLITIALAGGVLVWLTGYVGGFQSDIVVKTGSCNRLNADQVRFNTYIYNAGQSAIPANTITMNVGSSPTQVTLTGTTNTAPIASGTQSIITTTATNSSTGGTSSGTYVLDVASTKGVSQAVFHCA